MTCWLLVQYYHQLLQVWGCYWKTGSSHCTSSSSLNLTKPILTIARFELWGPHHHTLNAGDELRICSILCLILAILIHINFVLMTEAVGILWQKLIKYFLLPPCVWCVDWGLPAASTEQLGLVRWYPDWLLPNRHVNQPLWNWCK